MRASMRVYVLCVVVCVRARVCVCARARAQATRGIPLKYRVPQTHTYTHLIRLLDDCEEARHRRSRVSPSGSDDCGRARVVRHHEPQLQTMRAREDHAEEERRALLRCAHG